MEVPYRNPEGYPDPVPYKALKNTYERQYRPIVYICSAFSGDEDGNSKKARRYCRFALGMGVIPIAPHLLFPQFMNEKTERKLAMFMDVAILSKCKELWVFGEPTRGMQNEIQFAKRRHIKIRYFDVKKED